VAALCLLAAMSGQIFFNPSNACFDSLFAAREFNELLQFEFIFQNKSR
jgi:hypothetical protein